MPMQRPGRARTVRDASNYDTWRTTTLINGSPELRAQIALSRVDELRREAARHRAAALARMPRRPTGEAPRVAVTIRLCGPYDAVQLARLAALDSRRVPAGPILLAYADGVLRAALSLSDGTAVADPLFATAGMLALLRARARQLGHHRAARRGRLRLWAARRVAAT
jgi:hypothetical protein